MRKCNKHHGVTDCGSCIAPTLTRSWQEPSICRVSSDPDPSPGYFYSSLGQLAPVVFNKQSGTTSSRVLLPSYCQCHAIPTLYLLLLTSSSVVPQPQPRPRTSAPVTCEHQDSQADILARANRLQLCKRLHYRGYRTYKYIADQNNMHSNGGTK